MSEIKLTTKDADFILSYIRDQIKEENEEWKEYLKEKDDIINHYKNDSLFSLFVNDEEIASSIKMVEDRHNNNISKLMKFIELLTIGSEQ